MSTCITNITQNSVLNLYWNSQSSTDCSTNVPLYNTVHFSLRRLSLCAGDLHSESDPEVTIKLLYGNAFAKISDLLKPHVKAVKKEAGRFLHLGLHHVALTEDIIESADSVDSLLKQMSVTGIHDQTHFLTKSVASIPHSAPERGIAEAVLSHYHLHLATYEWATLLKDVLTEKSESEEEVEASLEANKLVDSFSCEDCHILQNKSCTVTCQLEMFHWVYLIRATHFALYVVQWQGLGLGLVLLVRLHMIMILLYRLVGL